MADLGLTFDSGIKSLELSDGKGHSIEVQFNPYDPLFLGKIMTTAEELDAIQQKIRGHEVTEWKELYQLSVDTDKEMREVLDALFEVPICDTLFPHQTVHALGNGFPAWVNLLYALIDHMDAGLTSEKLSAQQRIRKYSEKYKR